FFPTVSMTSSIFRGSLLGPGARLDDLDEVGPAEAGREVLEDIGVDRAKGGVGPVGEPVGEGGQYLPLEVRPGTRRDGGADVGRVEIVIADAEHVGLDAGRDQRDLGLQVL